MRKVLSVVLAIAMIVTQSGVFAFSEEISDFLVTGVQEVFSEELQVDAEENDISAEVESDQEIALSDAIEDGEVEMLIDDALFVDELSDDVLFAEYADGEDGADTGETIGEPETEEEPAEELTTEEESAEELTTETKVQDVEEEASEETLSMVADAENTSFETAAPLTLGTKALVPGVGEESLYYYVIPDTEGVYEFISSQGERNTNPRAWLYDENKEELCRFDDGNPDYELDFYDKYVLDANKKYYLQVGDYDESGDPFYISVNKTDDAFDAKVKGKAVKKVSPGESVTFEVAAYSTGVLSYEWSGCGSSGTTEKCTFVPEQSGHVYCFVSDSNGKERKLEFEVEVDNKLAVSSVGDSDLEVKPGSTVTLKVAAIASDTDGLAYKWEREYFDGSRDLISGATGDTLTDTPTKSAWYYATVTDRYGNQEERCFTVKLNHLFAYPSGAAKDPSGRYTDKVTYKAAKGEEVKLEAVVSGDDLSGLRYEWEEESTEKITTTTGPQLIVTAPQKPCWGNCLAEYICRIYDEYGNIYRLTFYLEEKPEERPTEKSTEKMTEEPTETSSAGVKLNVSGTIPMKKKQTSTAVKLTGLVNGVTVKSVVSSNPSVVTVSQKNGVLTLKAHKKGKATITVTLSDNGIRTFTINVKTSKVKTKKINVDQKKLTLKKGSTHQIIAALSPLTSQEKIQYSSSDKKIATVSKKGLIKAKKKGKATITVTSGKKKVKIKVAVK